MLRKLRKVLGRLLLTCVVVALLVCGVFRFLHARDSRTTGANGVDESSYVNIGGIRQYVQLRGADAANPVVLWIHGGPGKPLTYLTYRSLAPLEGSFTFASFEQRGCGRTYYANADNGPVTDAQLLADLDEQVDYLRARFGQDQVIVVGQGWGSVLGVEYALLHPEKVARYVGVGQVVDFDEAQSRVASLAAQALEAAGHVDVAAQLREAAALFAGAGSLDALDVDNLVTMASLSLRTLGGGDARSFAQKVWMAATSPDLGIDDVRWLARTLSTTSQFEVEHELVQHLYYGFDLAALVLGQTVPMSFIQGENDWTYPTDLVREWLAHIGGNEAQVIVVPGCGSEPFLDDPEAFAAAFREACGVA